MFPDCTLVCVLLEPNLNYTPLLDSCASLTALPDPNLQAVRDQVSACLLDRLWSFGQPFLSVWTSPSVF